MNLDLTRELEPAPVNESLNFKFASPLPPWEDYDEDSKEEFDNALNCYGVVYLRLLRAQRLPCPVGSSVCAVVSLPPWKGRVRTHRTSAFLSSLDHGVCVQWNEEGGFCSMVHAWHSEESPIPKIKVNLMFSPLGMGLFDFTMCSLELNVQVLMKQPGIWKENVWCPTSCTSSFHNSSTSLGGGPTKETDRIPMIQLDAMFAPSNDGRIATGQLKLPSTTTTTTTTTASTADPTKAKLSPQPSPPPPPPPPPQEDKELDLEQEALDESFASIDTTTTENNQQEPQPHTENSIALSTPTRATTTTIATTITTTTTTTTSPPPPTPLKHQPNPHQPHLLRIVNLWMPHSCAVCQKILVGRNAGFHCEECGIQCCSDCRLHIDIQIPCGSETAKKKTAPKLNMNSLLSIVAPDEAYLYHNSTTANNKDEDDTTMANRAKDHVEAPQPGKIGIGSLQLDIVKACLFAQPLPADSDSSIVFGDQPSRQADYYARVSITDNAKTTRTRTLQKTGMPKFNAEMQFQVAHYGVEYRLDVIDASTDAVRGTFVFTTQGILQEQRDILIAKQQGMHVSLVQCLFGPLKYTQKRRLKVELRAGVQSNRDFFAPPSGSTSRQRKEKKNVDTTATTTATTENDEKDNADETNAGAISGWMEIDVGLEEYTDRLYGLWRPYASPPRPPPEFNMINFQTHIARVKALIDDAKYAMDKYNYVISWKNSRLTGASLVIFCFLCLLFNAEYSGSRSKGARKARFVRKEIEACRKAESISILYTLHRPMSTLRVSVSRGKGLISRDLGIPGKTSCHVVWDPLRFCSDEKAKHAIVRGDQSAETKHSIGCTGAKYSSEPTWDDMFESIESRRLKQLLPAVEGLFFEASSHNNGQLFQELVHPILQPFAVSGRRKDSAGRFLDSELKDWESSPGAIVIQVRFQDFLNSLPGFESILGEVVFPFSNLSRDGAISGWFQVLDVGMASEPHRVEEIDPSLSHDDEGSKEGTNDKIAAPCIFVSLKWRKPEVIDEGRDEMNREISYVIQEELVRSSVLAKHNTFDLVGSSLGAVNTALGIGNNVQLVQNSLGSILDSIESAINAFNFIDPFKSSFLFIILFCISLVLILIPTRYIILALGLTQYAAAFFEQYKHKFKEMFPRGLGQKNVRLETTAGSTDNADSKESNVALWIANAMRSLPTNEDLRKTYFWESRRLGAQESEKHASEKRLSRLKRLWKAQWHSSIRLRVRKAQEMSDDEKNNALQWKPAFAMIQGHRFLWWDNVADFDNGELPVGRLFLSGHAGLTQPSPIEMREIPSKELPLIVSIFGRGPHGQERATILTLDSNVKEELENTVQEASFKDE